MEKIPTVFKRDFDGNPKYVLPDVNPGCEWVLAGEGKATRKYDGTCVMFDGDRWWARREVKPGKKPPAGWREAAAPDANTGKRVGWEPVERSGFAKWHAEAVADMPDWAWNEGTYELCGPKINGNPEDFIVHKLVEHADAEKLYPHGLDFEGLRDTVLVLNERWGVEGLVFHHPDGRMAKIKARDFERATGTRNEEEAADVA